MSDRRIPSHILNAVTAADETLREGERLIFERINGRVFARVETADVPVLGTTPVVTTSEDGLVTTIDKFGDGSHITRTLNVAITREEFERGLQDPLAHLSPADRESARRLNEALLQDE